MTESYFPYVVTVKRLVTNNFVFSICAETRSLLSDKALYVGVTVAEEPDHCTAGEDGLVTSSRNHIPYLIPSLGIYE